MLYVIGHVYTVSLSVSIVLAFSCQFQMMSTLCSLARTGLLTVAFDQLEVDVNRPCGGYELQIGTESRLGRNCGSGGRVSR